MSTRVIVLVVALLIAAGAGGIAYWMAPDLFRDQPALVEQPGPEQEPAVAREAVPAEAEPAAEIAADEAAHAERVLIAPSFDIIRVEPSGELLAAGRAAPGAAVDLLLFSEPWGSDVTNADGEWAILPSDPLSIGEHELSLRATGAGGEGGPIEGDRATVVIDGDGEVPTIALARPGEPLRVVQQPEEVAAASVEEAEVAPAAEAEPERLEAIAAADVDDQPTQTAEPEPPPETGPEIALLTEQPETTEEAREPAAVPEIAAEPEVAAEPESEVAEREEVTEEPAAVPEPEREFAAEPESEVAEREEVAEEPVAAPEPEPALAAVPEPAAEPDAAAEAEGRDEASETVAALPPARDEAEPEDAPPPAMVGIDTVEVTEAERLILTGRADPGATVRFSVNDEALGEVVADASGAWTAAADLDLPPGRYVARAELIDTDGEVLASARLRFDRVRIALAEPVPAEAVDPVPLPAAEPEVAEAETLREAVEAAPEEAQLALAEPEPQPETAVAPAPAEPEVEPVEVAAAPEAEATPREEAVEEPAAAPPAEVEAQAEPADVAEPAPVPAAPVEVRTTVAASPASLQEEGSAEVDIAVAPADSPEPVAGVDAGEAASLPESVYIQRGDNLWRIARSIYGRGIEYKQIYEANRSQIRNPHLIFPGQVFTIPLPDETDDPA